MIIKIDGADKKRGILEDYIKIRFKLHGSIHIHYSGWICSFIGDCPDFYENGSYDLQKTNIGVTGI